MKHLITIYAATSNKGKLAEFARCASEAGVTVLALPGLEQIPEPVEDADTFLGNAAIKARAYSLTLPGELVLADDSGLEVDALDGRPGVRSARFAEDAEFDLGLPSKDERNNRYLLALMPDNLPRTARFVCALALARDGEVLLEAEGEVAGEILHGPHGTGGFGYDPLFLVPERNLTMAELEPEEKWAISHRGNAFRALLAKVKDAGL
jgi:XTP/dITP diphosphohydrolase